MKKDITKETLKEINNNYKTLTIKKYHLKFCFYQVVKIKKKLSQLTRLKPSKTNIKYVNNFGMHLQFMCTTNYKNSNTIEVNNISKI